MARLLASRGLGDPETAREFLRDDMALLADPFLMKDMDRAVERIRLAVRRGEKTAVYGDYDVDGLTSSTIMTNWLRDHGLDCETYIPERLTEGYGVSEDVLRCLAGRGVRLIVTVDCGVTAVEQARLARELGMEMVITDHHECGAELPEAVAVVNPHRKDCPYPFKGLAGVGVAFKLICALEGDAAAVMEKYGALAAIGTIADIMPMVGENRCIVRRGVAALRKNCGVGLAALIREAGLEIAKINTVNISFVLVPKLNAAGRMGKVRLAFDLLISRSEAEAEGLAGELCRLNFERRNVENEVFADALNMLDGAQVDGPIILASETWHQGVSGIVASRLAEKYGVPAIIICIVDGSCRGSCRSADGFNIFAALEHCSDLLESYGGHEFAAGLTFDVEHLAQFRERMREYYLKKSGEGTHSVLCIDYELEDISLLSFENVEKLSQNEPWGLCFPPVMICMRGVTLEQLMPIGGDKHLKLRLARGGKGVDAVFFSKTLRELGLKNGELVDAAFEVSINEFRGMRSVQLLMKDMRRAVRQSFQTQAYNRFFVGKEISCEEKSRLLPDRSAFASVWKTLSARKGVWAGCLPDVMDEIASRAGCCAEKTAVCLRVFEELGIAEVSLAGNNITICPDNTGKRVSLDDSDILRRLKE